MEPREILRQEFEKIKAKIPENINSNVAYEELTQVCGFGYIPKKYEIDSIGSIEVYRHRLYATKPYYDEGCATYKLIKFLDKHFQQVPLRVFWRKDPEVIKQRDLYKYLPTRYIGRVRFSDKPEIRKCQSR